MADLESLGGQEGERVRISELPLDPTKNVQAGTLIVAYEYKPIIQRIKIDSVHRAERIVRRKRIGRGWLMKFAQPLISTKDSGTPNIGVVPLPEGTKDIRSIGELTLLEMIGYFDRPVSVDETVERIRQIFDCSNIPTSQKWRFDKFQYFKLRIVFSDRIDWRIQIALEDAFGKEVTESPQVEQVIKKLEEINVTLNK